MPAINKYRQLHNRQRVTTSPPIVSTTQLRGDQQPPNDDDNSNQDEIEAFVPLDVKNQPVTVQPIYFTNERDNTQRRITAPTPHSHKKQLDKQRHNLLQCLFSSNCVRLLLFLS